MRATRTVLGRPDELYEYKSPLDFQDLSEGCYKCIVKPEAFATKYFERYDCEHDLFTFALPNKTLYRVLDMSSGSPVFYGVNDTEYKVVSDASLNTITVTDPLGIAHIFGKYYETYPETGGKRVKTAWALSQIVCDNGRSIIFNWTSVRHLTRSWLGGFSFMDQIHIYDWVHNPFEPELFERSNADDAVFSRINETDNFLQLSSITFTGGSVNFTYSSSTFGPTLIAIDIHSDVEKVKSYKLSYFSGYNTLLQCVDGGEGNVYHFRYNMAYGDNPFSAGANLHAQDWWGYFNNKPAASLTPRMRVKTYYSTLNDEGTFKMPVGDADRSVDVNAMQAMILTGITWPTGGTTTYTYEPHRFAPQRMECNGEIHPDDDPYLSVGGGLRVKSITTTGDGDSAPQTITYQYPLATVRAVPSAATFIDVNTVCIPYPGRMSYHGDLLTEVRQVNVMPVSNYMRYDTGTPPIWYNLVTEIWPEGKVETEHADVLSDVDLRPISTFGQRIPTHSIHALGASPVVTRQTTYKSHSSGYVPVSNVAYQYRRIATPKVLTNYHINRERLYLGTTNSSPDFPDTREAYMPGDTDPMSGAYSLYNYSIAPWDYELTGKTTTLHTDNGDYQTTERYIYKTYTRLLTSVSSPTSEGPVTAVSLKYPELGKSSIENNMIQANFIGEPLAETILVGNAVTKAEADYTQPGPRIFRRWRTRVTNAHSSDTLYTPSCKFNNLGKLTKVTDADGISVDWAWDAKNIYPVTKSEGGLLSKYTYRPLVGLASVISPWGMLSSYQYDDYGRLTKVSVDGLGTLQQYAYTIANGTNRITATTWIDAFDKKHTVTTNYDRLGRKRMISDMATRLYQHFVYDAMGRCVRSSVPSTDMAPANYDYELYGYEPSPLNNPVSTIKAGAEWHNGGKAIRTRTLINTADGNLSCPIYEVTGTGMVLYRGLYPAGALLIRETVDENGHVQREYTNKSGLTVLTEEGDGIADMLRTRRVYDPYGRLVAILPPSFADGTFSTSDDSFIKNCFELGYDGCGRLTITRMPGSAAKNSTVYSRAGRVVAEHTAPMDEMLWLLHYYDKHGRQVLTTQASVGRLQLSSLGKTFSIAEYSAATDNAGYTLTPAPDFGGSVFSASYYDNYDFLSRVSGDNPFSAGTPRAGLKTGEFDAGLYYPSKRLQLGYYSVFQYDNWGRMIRSDRQNDHGLLTELYQTNLAGQITWSSQAFTPKSGATYNLEQSNTYDNAGRINQWEASLGGKTAGASLTYGKYGKVDTESFHNGVARNYAYDCHGWLTDIDTKVKVSRLSLIQPSLSADYYSQALTLGPDASTIVTPEPSWDYKTYTERVSYADGTFPRYDGTASAHRSSLGGEYSYRFDTHDRLIGAKYTPGPDNPTDEDFSVSYRYNETGAPLMLSRKGVIASTILVDGSLTERFGDIDRLTYNYDGVLLTDITAERMGLNFYGRVGFPLSERGGTASRLWNEAGLLKADTSQGIASVTYNHLGQPLTVTLSDKSQVLYSYSYDGRLQQIEYGERSGTASVGFTRVKNRRYYDGNFIFEDDALSMANFTGGYFDGKGQPYYRHSDWQGSVAMVTNGNGSLVQHNGYYPYGEPWRVVEGQPYLYGGKERLTNNDNIEYDFGARRYHSASALWSTPDPAAIKFPAQNPYVFCAANPIKYVDPTGKWYIKVHGSADRGAHPYGVLSAFDKNDALVFRTVVKLQGKGRDRSIEKADTPQGTYKILEWRKTNTPPHNYNPLSFGENDLLALDYIEGEGKGLRFGMHLHGGRKNNPKLSSTWGCIRIKDEDIKDLKEITDNLTEIDPTDQPTELTVEDDLVIPVEWEDREDIFLNGPIQLEEIICTIIQTLQNRLNQ